MNAQTKNFGKIADHPFEHRGSHGTVLKGRCDFKGGARLFKPAGITPEAFAADIAECFAFHSQFIWPDLNGFNGYGSIKMDIVLEPEDGLDDNTDPSEITLERNLSKATLALETNVATLKRRLDTSLAPKVAEVIVELENNVERFKSIHALLV